MRGFVCGIAAGLAWAATAAAQAPAAVPAPAPASGTASGTVLAPVPDPVASAQAALAGALDAAPLSLPVVAFVKERAKGYGMYDPRGSARFKPGETLFVYVEPMAFKYRQAGADVTFGLTMDFTILTRDGNILGGREKFLDVSFHSSRRNTEMMLNASISIQNAPAGDYQLELTVRDQSSADVARARLPFTVE